MKYTRNEFLKLSGIGITGAALSKIDMRSAKDQKLTLGLASYTLRSFSLDDTIKIVKRLNLSGISLKSMHMPLDSSPDEIKRIAEKVRNAGFSTDVINIQAVNSSHGISRWQDLVQSANQPWLKRN